MNEILTDLSFDDLRVGDHVLSWKGTSTADTSYTPEYPPDEFILCAIIGEYAYQNYQNGRKRFTTRDYALLYRVSRPSVSTARVPCNKCGKSIHPMLSSVVGVTHGCS